MIDRNVEVDQKVWEIYRDLRYEKKWRSLDIADQIQLLLGLNTSLKLLKKMNRENEAMLLTSEYVLNSISERGYSRTRKLMNFVMDVERDFLSFKLEDEESRKEMLMSIRGESGKRIDL